MAASTELVVATPLGAIAARRRAKTPAKRRAAAAGTNGSPNKRLSRLRKPEEMTLEAWQVALRQQYGREQKFKINNLGADPLFSEFEVTNPQTRRTYRVAIRGSGLGDNFCSCPDFAVNTLGTCKHIEFTLARLGRTAAARKTLAAGYRPPFSEIYIRYGAQREVVFHPGVECPAGLARLARQYFDDRGRLREGAFAEFHTFLKKAAAFEHDLRFYLDARGMIAELRDRDRRGEAVDCLFPRGTRSAAFKDLLKVSLYPYQREGALFLAKAGRAINADDMGLGKTIQAIAAVEILARAGGVERVLVVSPTSLKHQWKQEIERFTDRPVTVIEGLLPQRTAIYAADSFYKLTNYDVIHRDLDLIRRWQPDLVILDEAQRIKNWKTRTAQSVKRLESPYAFVLTGTPLENRLEELYSIVEFVDRFRLGPMFRFLDRHQHLDETGRVVGYRNLSSIAQTLQPVLIRRNKEKVLRDLPERMEKRVFVRMTAEQMKHHEENREGVARIVAKWRRYGYLSEADQQRLMIFLQNMRMSCDSTYLLDRKTDHGAKADELTELLGEMLEDPETKVVIFSQWVRMHELVAARLQRRKWPHVLFSGEVPGPQRKDLIRRFREDPRCRLFLSTDAGGVGLNLQHASAVVNLDQPWNPAVLEQRIGRVHRLGQHRPVRVVHFIAQGTIEEGMLALLSFKKSVFAGVLDGGQDEVFMGGTRLKRFMESVEKVTTSIPQPAPLGPPAAEEAERPSPEEEPTRRRAKRAAEEQARERTAASTSPGQEERWAEVITAGLALLEKLARTVAGGARPAEGPVTRGDPARFIGRDDASGEPYLRLPLPKPEILEKLVGVLAAFTGMD